MTTTEDRAEPERGSFLERHRRHLPRRLPRLLLALGLLLVPAVVVLRWFGARPESGAPVPAAEDGKLAIGESARKDAGIALAEAKKVVRGATFDAPGVLALDETRTARIGSLVEGNVIRVLAEVGERVAKGARLAELNSHVIHDAWADYRKALADRRRRETELTYATAAAGRAGRLLAEKAISIQEKERADADRVAAAEELDRAGTEVRRAEEALEHLGITNKEDPTGESGEEIPVPAPLAGVVLEKHVTAGTAVTPGTPLFVVSDLSVLWVLAEIDETRLPLVARGRPARVAVAAYPGETFPGVVAFVGDAVNPKTRRVTVRCTVPNATWRLKPEMYARVSLGEETPREVVVVPERAVQEMDGRPCVFVEGKDGKLARRDVALGGAEAGWVEVRSGVSAGEKVASEGSFLLKSELLKGSVAGEE